MLLLMERMLVDVVIDDAFQCSSLRMKNVIEILCCLITYLKKEDSIIEKRESPDSEFPMQVSPISGV